MQNPVILPESWRYSYIKEEQPKEIVLLNSGFVRRLEAWRLEESIQHFWVLWYNFATGASCISGNIRYELTPDKILLIPPSTVYTGQLNHPVPHFFLWFQTFAPFDSPARKIVEIPAEPYMKQLGQAIIQTSRTKFCHTNLLSNILFNIPEDFFQQDKNRYNSRVIEKAINFIKQRHGKVSNRLIAEHVHLSPTRFQHLFKIEVGIPPQRYCTQVKMSNAEKLLMAGMNIEQTAERGGFFDRFHFSKEFKKYHGISPAKWLKQFAESAPDKA